MSRKSCISCHRGFSSHKNRGGTLCLDCQTQILIKQYNVQKQKVKENNKSKKEKQMTEEIKIKPKEGEPDIELTTEVPEVIETEELEEEV